MIVTDLSKSFYPYPKDRQVGTVKKKSTTKSTTNKLKKEKEELKSDFCIMPQSTKYSTKRTKKYHERHEVFFGRAYRYKSIKDGLIVFLTTEDHTGTNGVHGKKGSKLNRYLKKIAQKTWMDHYKKSKEEFIQRYGQNYL